MLKKISSRNVNLYYITQFFDSLNFNIPIIIVFLQGKVTIPQVTFLFGYRYLIQIVSELPTGAFADLLGKKVSIIVGFFLNTIYFSMLFFSAGFPQLIIAYTLGGIGDSFLSGSTDALVYDSLKEDKKESLYSKVMAKQGLIYQVGLIIGTLSGGFLYTVNHMIPFFLNAGLQLLSLIMSINFIEPKVDSEKFTLKNYINQMKIGTKELFKNDHAIKISIFYIAVGGITWTCAMIFNSYMLVDLGFSDSARGLIEGSLRAINIIIINLLIVNNKFFDRKKTFLLFPIMMLAAFLPGPWLNGYYALPFISLSMMAASLRWILLGKYTNEEYDSKYRATAISALSMFVGFIYVFIMIVSGPVIAGFGGMRTIYFLLGILTLIIISPLALWLIKNKLTNRPLG